MPSPRRLETLAIGQALRMGWRLELRLVRDNDAHFILVGGGLQGPFGNREEALQWCVQELRDVSWRDGLTIIDGESACPTCGAPRADNPRVAQVLCIACVLEAVDAEGMPVRYQNTDVSGGFEAVHANRVSHDHRCWVRGQACWADEARFGGIVVRLAAA